MRIVYAFQVAILIVHYQTIEGYELGDYWEDETSLPKKSKIKFPDDDFLSENNPDYISKGITAPFGMEGRRKTGRARLFPLDDLRVRSHPLGGYAPSYGRSIGSKPLLLHPQVLVPNINGWIRNGGLSHQLVDSDIKPVTEPLPDDLKYDFRTKTHTLR